MLLSGFHKDEAEGAEGGHASGAGGAPMPASAPVGEGERRAMSDGQRTPPVLAFAAEIR